MIEIEIQIPPKTKTITLIKVIEESCSDHDLTCTLKGTLAKYPECIHWHFRKGKQRGILEVTWWEKEHRLWFKVADNRAGIWIDESLPVLKKKIEHALHKT
jgi:hypothetical protein